ncbi:MAG: DUF4421 domain-containing protein [Bacteroidaceae bacterium]|nr:DUF4421 domain-containing protein [Bacteroidaceae bacterium]
MHLDSTHTSRILLADSLLLARYNRLTYDTTYLARPVQDFTFKARMNTSGNGIDTYGTFNGNEFNNRLETDHNITTSFGITYRGISLALSLNPSKLSGKNRNTEFNISFYNNRYGLEASYQDARDYHGWSEITGQRTDFPSDVVTSRLLNLNAYYVFNHRRFSFPAAFTQSYLQLRNAGSWMLSFSCLAGEINARHDATIQNPAIRLRLGDIGVGGGYGYNWVLPHNWLLHGSALPTLVVGSFSRLELDGELEKVPYTFPKFILTERVAILHYFNEQHFAGITFVISNTLLGYVGDVRTTHDRWRLRVSYGFRFSL